MRCSRPMAAWASTTPSSAADQRQQNALGQQHPGDAAAARAERRAHREFLLAALCADQEQVGDVAAGDEQHDADGRQEDPQHAPHVADHVVRPAGGRSAATAICPTSAGAARSCAPRRHWPGRASTPGFSRARTWKSNSMWSASARSSCIGSSSAGVSRRNLNDAGSTPMISAGRAVDRRAIAR